MAKPHYIVQRSRSGRFNVTLLTSDGRLTGFVTVPIEGRSTSEIKQQALEKIRALAQDFIQLQGGEGAFSDKELSEPIIGPE